MAKLVIYRDNVIKESVIVGVSKSFPNNYEVSYTDTNVIIKSLQTFKNDVHIKWQEITDQEGTVFPTFNDLKAYLTIVFEHITWPEDGKDGLDGEPGEDGEDGLSAYDIWISEGNTGTPTDFIESLKGEPGKDGEDGKDGITPIKDVDYFDGEKGENGASAYDIWLSIGNEGTPLDFFEYLRGPKGHNGERGPRGFQGLPLTWEDLTPEQKEELKGEPGDAGNLEDNIPNIVVTLTSPNTGDLTTTESLLTQLNAVDFTILRKEVPMFAYTDYKRSKDGKGIDIYKTTRFLKTGSGNFGLNGSPVLEEHIGTIVESRPLNDEDLSIVGQVIELGDSHGMDLNTFINTTTNPEYELNATDLYFFTFTKDLIHYTYLYEGVQPVLLGEGNTQVTMSDFKLISKGSENTVVIQEDELPVGRKDQLYFIKEEGTNEVIPDWLMKKGIIVQTQREYDVASTISVDLENVFKTWKLFSHYNDTTTEGAYSPPNFPAFGGIGPNASDKLTEEEYYARPWSYDAVNNKVYLHENFGPYTGFISPREVANFTFEATMSSEDIDDDSLLLLIGFWVDPETGYEHTLSVERSLQAQSRINDHQDLGDYSYRVILNYSQLTEKTILDGSALAPIPEGTIGAPYGTAGWIDTGVTRVSVERLNNVYQIKTSQFGTDIIDDTTLITIDLADYPELEKFTVATKVGFGARSQPKASFSDIVFTGLIDYIFFKKEGFYETYEYDFETNEYFLQDPQDLLIRNYFGANRFVDSYLFNKIYFVTETDEIITIKGDNGISWDADNALTLGSDLRPYLSRAALNGISPDETKLLTIVSGWESGFNYTPFARWQHGGVEYTDTRSITLDEADPIYGRIDVFAVDLTLQQIIIIKGVASENPVKPEIDPETQLEGPFVLVDAGATAPIGATKNTIFDEGVGTPTEWTFGSIYFSITEVDAYSATKSIEGTNLTKGSFLRLTPPTPVAIAEIKQISLRIKNKVVSSGDIRMFFHGTDFNGNLVSNNSIGKLTEFGYNPSDITTWQKIVIPINRPDVNLLRDLYIQSDNKNPEKFGCYIDAIGYADVEEGGVVNPGYATVNYVNAQDAAVLAAAKKYHDDNQPEASIVFFKGIFPSFEALELAHPMSIPGAYADVDGGVGIDNKRYIWDDSDTKWIIQAGTVTYDQNNVIVVVDINPDDLPVNYDDDDVAAYLTTMNNSNGVAVGESEILMVNVLDEEPANPFDKETLVVNVSRVITKDDHNRKLLITAPVTLTWPDGGIPKFECNVDIDATGQLTIDDENNGVDLDAPEGTILEAGKLAHIYSRPDTNKLRLKGGWIE